MLESDWFTKILRCAIICMEMHAVGSGLDLHEFSYFKDLYSLQLQKNQNPQCCQCCSLSVLSV